MGREAGRQQLSAACGAVCPSKPVSTIHLKGKSLEVSLSSNLGMRHHYQSARALAVANRLADSSQDQIGKPCKGAC